MTNSRRISRGSVKLMPGPGTGRRAVEKRWSIPWKLIADPSGTTEYTLGTSGLNYGRWILSPLPPPRPSADRTVV